MQEKLPTKIEKCSICEKEGWVGNDKHINGDVKKRLCIMLIPKRAIMCLDCIEKQKRYC